MATRFEVALAGSRPEALRAAAEEALDEIARLEDLLSIYRPNSVISRLNREAASGAVAVDPVVWGLLRRALDLSAATDGAFDPTAGPLVRAWGFHGASGSPPDPQVLAATRECVGWRLVELDPARFTVRFLRPGVMLDLGAVGKGFALDRAVGILRDAGVESGLVHGGTSTVCALGSGPDGEGWPVALPLAPGERGHGQVVRLRDETLSVSAVWGRAFMADGRVLGHVIDPRVGEPVMAASMAAVRLPSATESDALSTALLVLGEAGRARLEALRPGIGLWLRTAGP